MLQTGQTLTAQGFEARFTAQAAVFLEAMVEKATQQVFSTPTLSPLLSRFQGVYLTDCTRIEAEVIPLKIAARLELQRGSLQLSLEELQRHDNATAIPAGELPPGALHIGDLGFFDLERFAQWQQAGVEWVSRYKIGTTLYCQDGQPLCLETVLNQASKSLHLAVQVGHKRRVPMYLVAQRVEESCYQQRLQRRRHRAQRKQRPFSPRQTALARWTLYLTSLPDLTFAQIHTLYRARWQIERLFKRWKSLGKLTTSTTADPHRRACEVYAKLLAVLVAHWLTQLHGSTSDALSQDKFFSILQQHASFFFLACFRFPCLLEFFCALLLQLLPSATLSPRQHRPHAPHLWQTFDDLP